MKPVTFFHPHPGELISGGHRYNRRMMSWAGHLRFPLRPVPIADGGPSGVRLDLSVFRTSGVCLWDSLLLPIYPTVGVFAERVDGWLMHYLPSLDPNLPLGAAKQARRLEDSVAADARFFLVTGQKLADELRVRYPSIDVSVCEPGVDAPFAATGRRRSRRAPRRRDGVVELLTVANLYPAKGYAELLEMLRRQPNPAWRWHIVGSASAHPGFAREFRSAASDLIGQRRIQFHGTLESHVLARLMRKMEIYVSASHFESYGMALAEALAAGLRAVVTDVGDSARLVSDADAGFCVPVGDWAAFERSLAVAMTGNVPRRACPESPRRAYRSWRRAFFDFATAIRSVEMCLTSAMDPPGFLPADKKKRAEAGPARKRR